MNKTTVYLPDDLRRSLKAAARRRRLPEADLVRDALRHYLEGEDRPELTSVGSGADDGLAARDSEAWMRQEWDT
ncbi:MAG TPA: CopG family transcriptional regulator [Candidatus Limnocylindria bacterium]|nr:CopG family transcriptional regulator [Candidatus Limnocylindria bacterium]